MKNQTKLQKYLFTLLFVLINSLLVAQFSRQQATDLVLNDIIAGDTINVEVFSLFDHQSVQDSIVLYNGEKIACPYSENWVFFINDHPAANWYHTCRYLFVDTVTGANSTITKRIYPNDWKINYETVNQPYQVGTSPMSTNTSSISGGLDPNPNYYAVILCGADQQRYWHDISGIYNTLISVYGYTKENIFVLYYNGSSGGFGGDLDNDGLADDIDYPANYYDIDRLFRNLSGELNDPDIPELLPGSQLFLFIDGHGEGDYLGTSYAEQNDFNLYDYELAEYLEDIKCSQMIIMLEPCLSGGFIDDLSDYSNYNVSCKNRSIHTAATYDDLSYAEMHMTWEGNVFMYFADEFVWYWNAAARGYFPVYDQPWLNTDVPIESYPFDDITTWTNHPPAYDPDVNGDGFVQMEEAFDYTNNFDTYSYYGFFDPYTLGNEDPQEWSDISFQEDLLFLSGLAGHVENTQTIENRSYLIGGDLDIDPEVTLTFSDGTDLYLGNENAQVNVSSGALLNIGNNMEIYGDSPNNITVNGNILVGTGVTFQKLGETGSQFSGLLLNNSQMVTNLNLVTFNKAQIYNYGAELNVTNTDFIDSYYIFSYAGNVYFDSCYFYNTWLYLENQTGNPNYIASVENSTFTTEFIPVAIDIWNYGNFSIEGDTISGHYNGIQLMGSGGASISSHNISNNEISNCSMAGILVYNSTADFSTNHMHNNFVGVRLFNNSNTLFSGDPNANNYQEVNYITNNDSYEVYASTGSFPWYFRYNAIIDEDNHLGNPTYPMVYWEAPPPPIPLKDVRYNCWGNNFDPEEDLYPGFMVYPTWCPGGGGNKSSEIALQTFLDGKEHFENEEYTDAEETFESVIELYPATQYASAAMKELFALEKFTDNDYNTLKQYYATTDSIQADTVLTKLSDFLANKCEIEMENWQTAIDHYEDIIDNPETTEDSIFAIIDLGYTYFLMGDTTSRSVVQGKMLEHKPKSKEEFAEKRDYLLSLLPITKTQQEADNMLETLKVGELLQNVPNPFANTTTIYYKLNEQSSVLFKVYNHIGKEVSTMNQSIKNEGINKIELDMSSFSSGIYFYSLFINGQLSDTKKMVAK